MNAYSCLKDLIFGTDSNSAADYIRSVCGDIDYTVGGGTFVFHRDDGSEVTFARPEIDVLGTPTVTSFYKDYRNGVNELREWLTKIVNDAIASIAKSKSLGVVKFTVSGDEDFATALKEKTVAGITDCTNVVKDAIGDALSDSGYTDLVSASIWKYIDQSKGTYLLCDRSSFRDMYMKGLEEAAGGKVNDAGLESQMEQAWTEWHADADRLLRDLRPLCSVA